MTEWSLEDLEAFITELDKRPDKPLSMEELFNSVFVTPGARKRFNEMCDEYVKSKKKSRK